MTGRGKVGPVGSSSSAWSVFPPKGVFGLEKSFLSKKKTFNFSECWNLSRFLLRSAITGSPGVGQNFRPLSNRACCGRVRTGLERLTTDETLLLLLRFIELVRYVVSRTKFVSYLKKRYIYQKWFFCEYYCECSERLWNHGFSDYCLY
jgi:hypothetical protein